MSTYAGERQLGGHESSDSLWQRGVDRVLAAELHVSREMWCYVGLVAIAALLRFTDLGARALHHDESLHATYSWYFVQGKGYVHDPLMHGPFLFHITALVYLLFGASDATSRFTPALFGTALIFLPYLLRPWLGRTGALATAVFLMISPSLLYYSRFIRDDPYIIFFTLALIVCVFRFRLSQRPGWLYAAALLLSLSFASMEITYIIAAIVLVYLDGCAAAQLTESIANRQQPSPPGVDPFASQEQLSPLARGALFLGLLPVAWLILLVWGPIKAAREKWDIVYPADGPMLLVLGLLTAPQFAAAIRVPLKKIGYDIQAVNPVVVAGRQLTRYEFVGFLTVMALLLVSTWLGIRLFGLRWLIIAAIFYVPYFLLFTTFMTNRAGWGSGIWGALNYWLDQQDVRRGTQPVFYFAMTLSAYEYLAMGLAAAGLVARAVRRGLDAALLLAFAVGLVLLIPLANDRLGDIAAIPFVVAAIGCSVAAMRGDPLRQFLVLYFGCIFFSLSIAGEKMPWLTEHPALPLTLLAGLTVRDAAEGVLDLGGRVRSAVLALGAAGVALAGGLAFVLASTGVAAGTRLLTAGGALLIIAALISLCAVYLLNQRQATERRLPGGGHLLAVVATAAFAGFFGALTLRADWRLSWVHPDTPDEMLIYTQSSPDIHKVAKQIDQFARESGQGKSLKITVDSNDSFTWPWAWYLRNYPNTGYPDLSASGTSPGSATALSPGSVLIVNAQDQAVANQFASQYGAGQRLHHRWWFPEDGYRGIKTSSLLTRVQNGSEFRRWWTYVSNRDGFAVPPSDISLPQATASNAPTSLAAGRGARGEEYLGSVDSYVFFPAEWIPGKGMGAVAAVAGASTAHLSGSTLTFGAAGVLPGQMRRPAGLAVDTAGNIFVADSLNNRVQEFDAQGSFVAQTGGVASGVQLNEPWGVAVDAGGFVYVADTWNHRIVKLDQNLHLVTAWGNPSGAGGPASLLDLYGPRGLAVDAAGTLWVVDTGNARVIHYTADGTPITAFGGHGTAGGQFEEPVGIAIAADGTIFVADTWNNRIEYFDRSFAYQGEVRGDAWAWATAQSGREPDNKPYIAALPDGTLLATFPDGRTLTQFDRSGNVLRSSDRLPGLGAQLRLPLGVATGPDGTVYLSDGTLNQIVRLPEASLAQP